MSILSRLQSITPHVLTGEDALPYGRDWVGKYETAPLAVVRPGTTEEVSAILALCHETGTPVVPMGGNTGLDGGHRSGGRFGPFPRSDANHPRDPSRGRALPWSRPG